MKRSAKIYKLATNRGKTISKIICKLRPRHNAVTVCTGDRDDVYIKEDNSAQAWKTSSVVLTGVQQK